MHHDAVSRAPVQRLSRNAHFKALAAAPCRDLGVHFHCISCMTSPLFGSQAEATLTNNTMPKQHSNLLLSTANLILHSSK